MSELDSQPVIIRVRLDYSNVRITMNSYKHILFPSSVDLNNHIIINIAFSIKHLVLFLKKINDLSNIMASKE